MNGGSFASGQSKCGERYQSAMGTRKRYEFEVERVDVGIDK
jgi:hypothetical protein